MRTQDLLIVVVVRAVKYAIYHGEASCIDEELNASAAISVLLCT